ncbi:MAG TPA: hypothetical protein VGE72_05370 [Azospirillum sp.]
MGKRRRRERVVTVAGACCTIAVPHGGRVCAFIGVPVESEGDTVTLRCGDAHLFAIRPAGALSGPRGATDE